MGDQAARDGFDRQVGHRGTRVDAGVQRGSLIRALVGAHQDQRATPRGVAVTPLEQAAEAQKASSPRRPTRKRTGWRCPQVGGPAGGLQQGDQVVIGAARRRGRKRAGSNGRRCPDGSGPSVGQPIGGRFGTGSRYRPEKPGARLPYP